MYAAIGEQSKKVYARGNARSECLRRLTEMYPFPQCGDMKKDGKYIDQVLPEPILITRGEKDEDEANPLANK